MGNKFLYTLYDKDNDVFQMNGNNIKSKIKSSVKRVFITEEVFWNNEIDANMLLARIMVFSAIVLVITNALNYVGIYKIPSKYLDIVTLQGLFELLIPAGLCYRFKGQKRWLKWLMLIMLTFVYARVYTAIPYRTAILMVIPVLLSCRYYSRALTEIVSIVTTIGFLLAAICSKYFGSVDMNIISAQETEVPLKAILLRSFLPSYILFWIAAIAAFNIAYKGKKMILKQDEVSRNKARVDTELSMAKQIQERALPIVSDLPEHDEYELSAFLATAKEVGGDFYDFMYVDPTHLAIVIADVSGKGVPAALYMMISKTLLANRIMLGGKPSEILADVNNQLCDKRINSMFVTVWLGIIDLTNGHVITANAGHEYPAIYHKGSKFELFKDKHGLVLGGYSDMKYVDCEFTLNEGDSIFVYTDGIPEAHNENNELFGTSRMLDALNNNKDCSLDELVVKVKKEIDIHSNGVEQFDDITMVAFYMSKYMKV